MRNTLFLIAIFCTISILMFVIYTKANDSKIPEDEALKIGEEKYLEFLWIVDGAFNSKRFDGEFTVNGKKLDDDNKKFTCIYKNKKDDTCVGKNFEESFHNLFSSNITYDDVYADDSRNAWISYKNGSYYFTNITSCNVNRMNLEQTIKIYEIEKDKLTFHVFIEDSGYQNTRKRIFSLIKENDIWKISKAYYEDLCEIKYSIK